MGQYPSRLGDGTDVHGPGGESGSHVSGRGEDHAGQVPRDGQRVPGHDAEGRRTASHGHDLGVLAEGGDGHRAQFRADAHGGVASGQGDDGGPIGRRAAHIADGHVPGVGQDAVGVVAAGGRGEDASGHLAGYGHVVVSPYPIGVVRSGQGHDLPGLGDGPDGHGTAIGQDAVGFVAGRDLGQDASGHFAADGHPVIAIERVGPVAFGQDADDAGGGDGADGDGPAVSRNAEGLRAAAGVGRGGGADASGHGPRDLHVSRAGEDGAAETGMGQGTYAACFRDGADGDGTVCRKDPVGGGPHLGRGRDVTGHAAYGDVAGGPDAVRATPYGPGRDAAGLGDGADADGAPRGIDAVGVETRGMFLVGYGLYIARQFAGDGDARGPAYAVTLPGSDLGPDAAGLGDGADGDRTRLGHEAVGPDSTRPHGGAGGDASGELADGHVPDGPNAGHVVLHGRGCKAGGRVDGADAQRGGGRNGGDVASRARGLDGQPACAAERPQGRGGQGGDVRAPGQAYGHGPAGVVQERNPALG
ncbi:hypothetical protein ASZ90_000522 [hydrocarbon metagenome]|uniref:Uncharacterized protein n=1 Tax=hydrocarbon metagenome TaxID=938273 RepID=A0A0W8G8W4_9ZZZZ